MPPKKGSDQPKKTRATVEDKVSYLFLLLFSSPLRGTILLMYWSLSPQTFGMKNVCFQAPLDISRTHKHTRNRNKSLRYHLARGDVCGIYLSLCLIFEINIEKRRQRKKTNSPASSTSPIKQERG